MLRNRALLFGCAVFIFGQTPAWAIVGQAERYDEFDEKALENFQEGLMREDLTAQVSKMDAINKALAEAKDGKKNKIDEELEKMRLELLAMPKRELLQFDAVESYKYANNVARAQLRHEKGDSMFSSTAGGVLDLSGRKTDFRLGVNAGKEWNVERPESDTFLAGSSLNYRRKYYKKVNHSLQYKLTRHNSKTVEINGDKVRYDFGANSAYNYPISRKIAMNSNFNFSKRLFTQEAFDSDSQWDSSWEPSLFYNITPKSRVNLGYKFGASRIRSKSGDSNTHELHFGYFGKVTRKSSTSVDIAYSHQVPRSNETATINTYTVGMGYIWQWTAKTQLTVQLLRSLQNSTSELVSGDVDGESVTEKTDIYFSNSSLTASLNTRFNRKIEGKLGVSISHMKNKTEKRGSNAAIEDVDDVETQQINFPIDVSLTYNISRFANLSLGYSFFYRSADEKPDRSRGHELTTNLRLVM